MEFLHNSRIKKDASVIFELNQFDKPVDKVMPFVQPVIEVKPITVVKSWMGNSTFTPQSDKSFFLTSIQGVYRTDVGATGTITFYPINDLAGVTIRVSSVTGEYNTFSYDFGGNMQGVLLEKGTGIETTTFNGGDNDGFITITGYYGSDRS